ncbi:hypothetical protein [Neptunomonas qingdaonensis]|uniref:hypothetical protein n=1 Tax=Neptunomonas qingdaonensis TaxID=1045558 RepID=UPI0011603C42|nr:hypothetical protein [Neptunomonas qingdaonensis]
MSNALPRMAAMLVILLAIPLIYQSFRWAAADMNAYPVRYAIERWQSSDEAVTLAALDKVTDNIDTSLDWSADNAEYYELKARLLLYRALLSREEPADFESNIRQALSLHESAIGHRPHWPYSWANKSLMKAYLGEFDQEFSTAVAQAAKFGPWELSANLTVLEAGLIGWRQLQPELQIQVLAAAERATDHRFRAVRTLLDRYRLRYPMCSQMTRSPQRKKLCQ